MKYFSWLSPGVALAANGEPPFGIPWETYLYQILIVEEHSIHLIVIPYNKKYTLKDLI